MNPSASHLFLCGLYLIACPIYSSMATAQAVRSARSIFILAPEWRAMADSLFPSGPEYVSLQRIPSICYPLKADTLALLQLIENGRTSLQKKSVDRSTSRTKQLEDPAAMPIRFIDTTVTVVCDAMISIQDTVRVIDFVAAVPEERIMIRGKVLGAQGGAFNFMVGKNYISGQLEFGRQPEEFRKSWRMRSTYLMDIRYLGPPGIHSLVYSMSPPED